MRGSSWEYCSMISPPLLESCSASLHHESKLSIQWPSITGSLQKSSSLTSCSSLFTPTVQMDQIICFPNAFTVHTQATLPLHVFYSLPETAFPPFLSPHQTHCSSSSCHLLQEAFPASYLLFLPCWATCLSSVFHLSSLCINFDCWLTGLPSPLDQSFPKFLN